MKILADDKARQQENGGRRSFIVIPDTITYGVHEDGKRLSCCHRVLLAAVVGLSQNGPCFASNEYLADFVGIKKRQVMNLLQDLEHDGYIEKSGRTTKRTISPTQKTVSMWKECFSKASAIQCTSTNAIDCTSDKKKNELVQYSALNLCNRLHQTSAIDCTHNNKDNIKENIYMRANESRTSTHTNSKRKTKEAEARAEAEVLFDEKFWPAYPYHENSKGKLEKPDKKRAKAAFLRVKNIKQAFPFIMQALERWAGTIDYSKGDGKYTPYAATWLNGERWKDEVKEQPPAGASSSSWGGRVTAGMEPQMTDEERRAKEQEERRLAGYDD